MRLLVIFILLAALSASCVRGHGDYSRCRLIACLGCQRAHIQRMCPHHCATCQASTAVIVRRATSAFPKRSPTPQPQSTEGVTHRRLFRLRVTEEEAAADFVTRQFYRPDGQFEDLDSLLNELNPTLVPVYPTSPPPPTTAARRYFFTLPAITLPVYPTTPAPLVPRDPLRNLRRLLPEGIRRLLPTQPTGRRGIARLNGGAAAPIIPLLPGIPPPPTTTTTSTTSTTTTPTPTTTTSTTTTTTPITTTTTTKRQPTTPRRQNTGDELATTTGPLDALLRVFGLQPIRPAPPQQKLWTPAPRKTAATLGATQPPLVEVTAAPAASKAAVPQFPSFRRPPPKGTVSLRPSPFFRRRNLPPPPLYPDVYPSYGDIGPYPDYADVAYPAGAALYPQPAYGGAQVGAVPVEYVEYDLYPDYAVIRERRPLAANRTLPVRPRPVASKPAVRRTFQARQRALVPATPRPTVRATTTTRATRPTARRRTEQTCPKQPDWQPCVSKSEANKRFGVCCHLLGPGCRRLCNYDITQTTIELAVLSGQCPLDSMTMLLRCASGYNDARACCAAKGVFDAGRAQCRPFCHPTGGLPRGTFTEYFPCLRQLPTIAYCFRATLQTQTA